MNGGRKWCALSMARNQLETNRLWYLDKITEEALE